MKNKFHFSSVSLGKYWILTIPKFIYKIVLEKIKVEKVVYFKIRFK